MFHVGSNNPKLNTLGAKGDGLVVRLPGGFDILEMDIYLDKHHMKLSKVRKHCHSLEDEAALGFVITCTNDEEA